MQLEGENVLDAPIEQVWAALNDPDVLARCVPGVKALVPSGPDAYDAQIQLAVGPLKGNFKGKVSITDKVPLEAMVLNIDARATIGGAQAVGRLYLSRAALDDGREGTRVRWEGAPKLRGTLATVGARLLGPISKQQTDQFLSGIEREARRMAGLA